MLNSVRIILLAPALLSFSCGSGNKTAGQGINIQGYKAAAISEYGPGFHSSFNNDSTFVLCTLETKPSTLHPQHSLRYFIYDLNKNKKSYGSSLEDGFVEWENNEVVCIIARKEAGYGKKGNVDTTYYNVKFKRYVPVPSFEKDN